MGTVGGGGWEVARVGGDGGDVDRVSRGSVNGRPRQVIRGGSGQSDRLSAAWGRLEHHLLGPRRLRRRCGAQTGRQTGQQRNHRLRQQCARQTDWSVVSRVTASPVRCRQTEPFRQSKQSC